MDLPRIKVGVPCVDFKQYIISIWQDDLNGAASNKLHFVKSVLGDWQSSYRRCRKDEVVVCHTRIGHTHLTHSYILRKDPPPQCEHCQCILTVRHILVECNHFSQERKYIFGRRDVVESVRFHPTLMLFILPPPPPPPRILEYILNHHKCDMFIMYIEIITLVSLGIGSIMYWE